MEMGEDVRTKRIKLEDELPPPDGGGDGGPDLMTRRLNDDMLGCIITRLPTKDAARTQILSSWWKPLWRSAPLNLEAKVTSCHDYYVNLSRIARILSAHQGRVRRFSLTSPGRDFPAMDSILESKKLDQLEVLEIYVQASNHLLPLSVLRFSPTLCVLILGKGIRLPSKSTATFNFPHLKELTLLDIKTSESALHEFLAGCPVLESLLLDKSAGCRRLHISSLTLRSLGVSDGEKGKEGKLEELIIENAPRLEKLIPRVPNYGLVIRVIQAPRLRTIGYLHDDIFTVELGNMLFEKMVPENPSNVMHSVKILALLTAPNLELVIGLLKCFPCVQKLYIVSYTRIMLKNVQSYTSLECLDRHLKTLHITNYEEKKSYINFMKFFVLNARVLEYIKFVCRGQCDPKWIASQHKKLQVNDRASRGARFDFEAKSNCLSSSLVHMKHIHDSAMDPFDGSLCRCNGDDFL